MLTAAAHFRVLGPGACKTLNWSGWLASAKRRSSIRSGIKEKRPGAIFWPPLRARAP